MKNSLFFTSQDIERLLQLNRKKLHYWRKIGLIHPQKTKGNHCRYDFRDLIALKAIIRLERAGIKLSQLKTSLDRIKAEHPGLTNPLAEKSLFVFGNQVYAEGKVPHNLLNGQYTFVHNHELKEWIKLATFKSLGSDDSEYQLRLNLG